MAFDYGALEGQRSELQNRLDALKSRAERNELGQFATPPFLAKQMAEYVRDLWKDRADLIRFLDPALGTGSLYSALYATVERDLLARATGVELDEAFADASAKLWADTGLEV